MISASSSARGARSRDPRVEVQRARWGRIAVLVTLWPEEGFLQRTRRQPVPTARELVAQRDSGFRCRHGGSHWQLAVGAVSLGLAAAQNVVPSRRLSACTRAPFRHPGRGIAYVARRWPITRPAGERRRGIVVASVSLTANITGAWECGPRPARCHAPFPKDVRNGEYSKPDDRRCRTTHHRQCRE
jgi:hypothetical protein